MRFSGISFFLFLFAFAAQAQVKLPPKENNTPVKQTPSKTSETKSSYSEPVLILKITSDISCKFYLDGEFKASINSGEIIKLNLRKGEYQFKAVDNDNTENTVKQIYPVTETGIEKYYNIAFNKNPAQTQSNAIVQNGSEAQVIITWTGPGSVKLYFNKEEYFLTEGQKKTLDLKSEQPYSLKAEKPDKTYSYNDFLTFAKGKQYYKISLTNAALQIEKALSPEEIAAYFENRMVYVSGGTFNMGCSETAGNICNENEKPVHTQSVNSFYIGKYETTIKEFKMFIDDTGYKTSSERNGNSNIWNGREWEKKPGVTWKCDMLGNLRPESEYNYPVTHIDQSDALTYCLWLQLKTGKKFRLPSEEEWEYASRGGNKSKNYKFSGSNDLNTVAWNSGNSESKAHPAGQKQPNELGLYDMCGNVFEMTTSKYSDNYNKSPDPTDTIIVGFVITYVSLNDSFYVTKTEKGYPADKAGMEAGDKIVMINGETISGKTTNEITLKIKGEQGTSVTFTVQKNHSSKLSSFTIQRDNIFFWRRCVARGGCFYGNDKTCTNTCRSKYSNGTSSTVGFRVVHD